jgi:hypothetical protein
MVNTNPEYLPENILACKTELLAWVTEMNDHIPSLSLSIRKKLWSDFGKLDRQETVKVYVDTLFQFLAMGFKALCIDEFENFKEIFNHFTESINGIITAIDKTDLQDASLNWLMAVATYRVMVSDNAFCNCIYLFTVFSTAKVTGEVKELSSVSKGLSAFQFVIGLTFIHCTQKDTMPATFLVDDGMTSYSTVLNLKSLVRGYSTDVSRNPTYHSFARIDNGSFDYSRLICNGSSIPLQIFKNGFEEYMDTATLILKELLYGFSFISVDSLCIYDDLQNYSEGYSFLTEP